MNERRSFLAGILTLPWAAKTLAGGGYVPRRFMRFEDLRMDVRLISEGTAGLGRAMQLGGFSPRLDLTDAFPAHFDFEEDTPPANYSHVTETIATYDTLVINLYPSSNIISQVLS